MQKGQTLREGFALMISENTMCSILRQLHVYSSIVRRRTCFGFWATPLCCGKSRRQKEGNEIDILRFLNERLRSTMLKSGGLYTGATTDLDPRLLEHFSGRAWYCIFLK